MWGKLDIKRETAREGVREKERARDKERKR